MSVFNKKLHMVICMHVDDDGGIVDNVVMQILQILSIKAKFLNSFY